MKYVEANEYIYIKARILSTAVACVHLNALYLFNKTIVAKLIWKHYFLRYYLSKKRERKTIFYCPFLLNVVTCQALTG